MTDPTTAWSRLRAANGRPAALKGNPGQLIPGETTAAVLRCADSAVPSETVFGLPAGSVLDISTWGHSIDTSVLATLEFAVETLRVPLIVVLGHNDCTALSTAQRAWERAELPDGAARTVAEQVMWSIVRRHAPADSVDAVAAAHAIETGLGLVARSPIISRKVDAQECAVVCATFDTKDGQLRTHATIGSAGERQEDLAECV